MHKRGEIFDILLTLDRDLHKIPLINTFGGVVLNL